MQTRQPCCEARACTANTNTISSPPALSLSDPLLRQLPVWLGVGTALKNQIAAGKLDVLQQMYAEWPFFRSTIELLEMVLSKTSKSIAAYYETLLVPEDLQGISERVWTELDDTMAAILEIIKGSPMMGSGMENSRLSIAARGVCVCVYAARACLHACVRACVFDICESE